LNLDYATVKAPISKAKTFTYGYIQVWNASCTRMVPDLFDWTQFKQSGNRATIALTKSGSYRIAFIGYSAKHRYGFSSVNRCEDAPKVKVTVGKTVKRTLTAKSMGKLHATGYKLNKKQGVAVYQGSTGKFIGWISLPSTGSKEQATGYGVAGPRIGAGVAGGTAYTHKTRGMWDSLLPGKYRVAKVGAKLNKKNLTWTPTRKTLRSGKLVSVTADRGVSIDLGKNRVQAIKDQSLKADVRLTGVVTVKTDQSWNSYEMAKIGTRLTAKPSGFAKGTKFSYQWTVNGRTVSRSSSYTVKTTDDRGRYSLLITAKRKGYFTYEQYAAGSIGLEQLEPDWDGSSLTLGGPGWDETIQEWNTTPGDVLTVGDPQFWEATTPSYTWTTDGGTTLLGTSSYLSATAALDGKAVTVTATYSAKGYRPYTTSKTFTVQVNV
ncbi:MAG: hypothetical protein J0H64_07250, partial [Actinobacteria bacterium]|nr:hypothetical protein [Actinomycetota bacterium]